MEAKWIMRWKHWIAPTPIKEGVWRRKEGGYLIRGRARCPRTGKLLEVRQAVMVVDAADAYLHLQRELSRITGGVETTGSTKQRFSDFAVSLLERKVQTGEIKSAKGREKWGYILRCHLLPSFGAYYLQELRKVDIELWRVDVAKKITAGQYKPSTANDWLAVLRVIMSAAVADLDLPKDPMALVNDFDTSEHDTYTEEEPNSLTPAELPVFLTGLRRLYPQHFAMAAIGFSTGLRPSSLRPLRREPRGKDAPADVLWTEGVLLVRQSHTRKQEVMKTTKTKRHQRIPLPTELVDILRLHISELPEGAMNESALLFPSETGGFRSPSCLDKPFRVVAKEVGLNKHITPRAMRRTFQDLARVAEIDNVVTRAISGHATEAMQQHYSTVSGEEVRRGLARVVDLAGFRQALATAEVGEQVGERRADARKAG